MQNVSGGNRPWSNPTRIQFNDGQNTLVSNLALGQISDFLEATNYGFAIFEGQVIDGIEILIDRNKVTVDDLTDNNVQLIVSGNKSGTNKAQAGQWPLTVGPDTYGGPTDLWGLSLSISDVNASNFGISWQVGSADAQASFASVDYIWIKVYHSTPVISSKNKGMIIY